MFEVIFLGTSASAPSVRRGLSAQIVKHNEHRFLVDCGEGTQRQILRSGLGFKRLSRILITHGHLDHMLGLAGLFSTFSRWETIEEVEIIGGKWALERIYNLLYGIRVLPPHSASGMSVILREVDPGLIIEEKDFTITAFPVTHRGPDCYGYLFEEHARRPFLPDKADALGVPSGPLRRDLVEGKTVTLPEGRQVHPDEVLGEEKPGTRLALTGDTGGTIDLVDTCAGVDTLITEATYLHTEAEMAGKFAHLTARQAGELARDAQVGNLIMTHISRRYREREVLEEAKAFFTNSWVARDFDVFQVKRSECVKVSGG